jgi:ferredoxin-like protein FixX
MSRRRYFDGFKMSRGETWQESCRRVTAAAEMAKKKRENTPQKVEDRLKAKAKKFARDNSDLSATEQARRLGVSLPKLRKLLSDDRTYPKCYVNAARALAAAHGPHMTVELVSEEREKGNDFCRTCKRWCPVGQFSQQDSGPGRHYADRCLGGKEVR